MTKEQLMVQEFHEKFLVLVSKKPSIPIGTMGDNLKKLRHRLIFEELQELYNDGFLNNDLVQIADALGDLLYVVYGTAVSFGIDLEPVFEEIHRSNMSKLWKNGVRKDKGGKVIKSPEYSPADLKSIIKAQKET